MRRRQAVEVDLPPVSPVTADEVREWIDWQVSCSKDPARWREWQARYGLPDEPFDPEAV